MPNHVVNVITSDNLDEIKKLCFNEKGEFDFEKIIPMPENIFRGNLGQKEREMYGKNNWYDWSCENWGTKWNAYDQQSSDDCISFSTAWNVPQKVYKKLMELLPNNHFKVQFADEDLGYNCGTLSNFEGNLTYEEPEKPLEFACNLWGINPTEIGYKYDEETKTWVYAED